MVESARPEPESREYVRRMRIGTAIICLFAVPIGVALHSPYVWGLAGAGLIVHGVQWYRHGSDYFV
jgi:hypothetical protein